MRVIHDGDAAYEDIMALSLLLLNADVVAVTVTYGEATTKTGAENMERICRMLKPSDKIPVAYGSDSALDHHGTHVTLSKNGTALAGVGQTGECIMSALRITRTRT